MKGTYNIQVIDENNSIVQEVSQDNTLMNAALLSLLNNLIIQPKYNTLSAIFDLVNTDSSGNYIDITGYAGTLKYSGYAPTPLTKVSTNPIVLENSGGLYGGKASYFNNCYYSHPNIAPTSSVWTQEIWFKTTTTATNQVIWQHGHVNAWNSTNIGCKSYLGLNGAYPYFGTMASAADTRYIIQSPTAIQTNRWYHLVGMHHSTYGNYLFVDGVLVAANPTYTQSMVNTAGGYMANDVSYIGAARNQQNTFGNTFTGYLSLPTLSGFGATRSTAGVVGSKYFTPSKLPSIWGRSYLNEPNSSSYRPATLILSPAVTANRLDANFTGDYVVTGSPPKSTSQYVIDLANPTSEYTVSVARTNSSTVTLSVMLNENFASGMWDGIYLSDIHKDRGMINDMYSYPFISKIKFNTPITKRPKYRMKIDWSISVTAS